MSSLLSRLLKRKGSARVELASPCGSSTSKRDAVADRLALPLIFSGHCSKLRWKDSNLHSLGNNQVRYQLRHTTVRLAFHTERSGKSESNRLFHRGMVTYCRYTIASFVRSTLLLRASCVRVTDTCQNLWFASFVVFVARELGLCSPTWESCINS